MSRKIIHISRGNNTQICSKTSSPEYCVSNQYSYYEFLYIPNYEYSYRTKCLCIHNWDKTPLIDIDINILNRCTVTKIVKRRYLFIFCDEEIDLAKFGRKIGVSTDKEIIIELDAEDKYKKKSLPKIMRRKKVNNDNTLDTIIFAMGACVVVTIVLYYIL